MKEGKIMDYSLERVSNIFGVQWVIYEDAGEPIQRVVFSTRDFKKAVDTLKLLRGE